MCADNISLGISFMRHKKKRHWASQIYIVGNFLPHHIISYRICSYSFHRSYSSLNLEIQRSVLKYAETIQGRKLYEEIRYTKDLQHTCVISWGGSLKARIVKFSTFSYPEESHVTRLCSHSNPRKWCNIWNLDTVVVFFYFSVC